MHYWQGKASKQAGKHNWTLQQQLPLTSHNIFHENAQCSNANDFFFFKGVIISFFLLSVLCVHHNKKRRKAELSLFFAAVEPVCVNTNISICSSSPPLYTVQESHVSLNCTYSSYYSIPKKKRREKKKRDVLDKISTHTSQASRNYHTNACTRNKPIIETHVQGTKQSYKYLYKDQTQFLTAYKCTDPIFSG